MTSVISWDIKKLYTGILIYDIKITVIYKNPSWSNSAYIIVLLHPEHLEYSRGSYLYEQ